MSPMERASAALRTVCMIALGIALFLLWGIAGGLDRAAGL